MPEDSTRFDDSPASVAAIVMLGAVAVAGFNIQPMYLGALADHLGFSAAQLGLIAGAEIAGSALAGVVAVSWVRRWNWRWVALAALLALGAGNLASAYATRFEVLIVLRSLTGFFGIGTSYALAIAALSATRQTERNFSIAIVAQVSIAILGFLMLPSYMAKAGTPAVFLPLAAIAFLLIPVLNFLPAGGRRGSLEAVYQRPSTAWLIWVALLCQCVWYLGLGGVWAFVERIAVNASIDAGEIGAGLAIAMAVGLLGAFVAAVIADRWGRVIPFALAMLIQLVALSLLADLRDYRGFVIAICLYNAAWNFALPYLFSLAALADVRGQLVVLMSTAQAVGLTVGASVAGALIGRWGLGAVPWQGGAAAFAALLIFVGLGYGLRGIRAASVAGK
jgi:predicted MFS family arabinose efflux permease